MTVHSVIAIEDVLNNQSTYTADKMANVDGETKKKLSIQGFCYCPEVEDIVVTEPKHCIDVLRANVKKVL